MSGVGTAPEEVELSKEQKCAIRTCLDVIRGRQGGFVFVTGNAGTGKSTILRELRKHARILVCAPTGLAAVNVGGETVHKLFGIRPGPLTRGKVRDHRDPWILKRADAIVMDEISMVRADLLDGVNACLQKTFGNDKPFGGMPVIAFGDLLQLEPVVTEDEKEWMDKNYPSHFFFDAHVFHQKAQGNLEGADNSAHIEICELKEIFRQQGNPEFLDALNAIRIGDPSGLEYLNQRAGIQPDRPPVAITFTRKKAEAINAARLKAIDADEMLFEAIIDGDFPEKDLPSPKELRLKVGAQVMFTRNTMTDYGQVANGSVGEVIGFLPAGPIVELRDGRIVSALRTGWNKIGYTFDTVKNDLDEKVTGTFEQVPLKLAWALTVHKAQGQTLDAVTLEMEREAFAHGQIYVAISRTKTLGGLFLKRRLQFEDIRMHPRVRQFCELPEFAAPEKAPLNLGALG